MCLDERSSGRVGRRTFLAGSAATVACTTLATGAPGAGAGRRQAPVEVAPGLAVLPRESWAAGVPAPPGLPTEPRGDVRVLLVHHSASANGYDEAAVAGKIRQIHALHTGPEKGWPDVAYNFFVDRFGRVWEGRAGSLDGPVIGDATGGNQGFSQLVCLVGNYVADQPSPQAVDALSRVLAWLAHRDGVDVSPGATTSFVSRGSNRWPAGATVETPTIAGHRDMSRTACPGDAAYARVRGDLPTLVAQRVADLMPATTATTSPPTTARAATTSTTSGDAASPTAAEAASARPRDGSGGSPLRAPFLAAGAAVIAAAGAFAVHRRRAGRPAHLADPPEPPGTPSP